MRNPYWTASLLAALLLPACGSSGPTMVAPTPTPVPCTQASVFQGAGALPAHVADFESITAPTTGRLDVTLDWTFASSKVGVFIAQGPCSFDQFKAAACNFLLSLVSPPKPLKGSASNVAAGSYVLIIANAADQNESVSAQVLLSSATCPALASRSPQDQSQGSLRGQVHGELTGILHR
ncbi:MAG TPA: hypothetical protein VN461_24175 [Vicinamibacteria bacterium]|nr:hypothetical protein [Vicinamibacteria bacterium]